MASPTATTTVGGRSGDLIAYLVRRGLQVEVRAVAPDGSDDRQLAGPVGSGTHLASECGDALSLAWSPDGSRLAFTAGSACQSTIYVVNVDGSGLRAVSEGMQPAWSPSGDRIAFTENWDPGRCADCGRTLSVASLVDGNVDLLVEHDTDQLAEPAWSSEGGTIAVTAYGRAAGPTISLVDVETGEVSNLVDGTNAAWSPDGSRLAYSRWVGTAAEGLEPAVFVASGEGGPEVRIGAGFSPAWSPRGDLLAFVKVRVSYDTGIAVSPPDASFHRELVSDVLGQASDSSRVDWSPDGEHVVFDMFNRERAADVVYVIHAEGGEPVGIAEGLAPAWQPEGEGE